MGLSLFGSKMKCGRRKKRLKIWVVGSSVFLFHSNKFKKTKKKNYEYRFRFFFNPKTLGLVKFWFLTQKKKEKNPKNTGQKGEEEEAPVSDFQKGHMHGGGAEWSSARVSVCTLLLS